MILVEGPIAAGKTEFAKSLADELDMHYIPQATMDDVYINEYGYDMRELDKLLPPGAQSFDEKRFVNDPKGSFTAALQLNMFGLKYVFRTFELTGIESEVLTVSFKGLVII